MIVTSWLPTETLMNLKEQQINFFMHKLNTHVMTVSVKSISYPNKMFYIAQDNVYLIEKSMSTTLFNDRLKWTNELS